MSEAPVEAFGPYLVYEQLGAGGMARVDRAALSGIEGFTRPIALKRMLPHCASNDDMVKAFVREARLASHLRHANVAQTYELGKVDDTYFIAMELITGRTLRAVLKHCAQTTGPMPVPISLNILNQICDALDYAHNLCDETGQPLGIIHRDVSPSNIIVDDAGVVKLIDFGIAKASAAGMQTMSGTIKGKFGYMAPEYIFGRIDARVDLFALGVIAHELLTNRPLFSVADDMETLQRVRSMTLAPPSRRNPSVPAEVDDIVMTALARDPDRRWQHATALRTALTTVTKRLGLVCHNTQVVEWLAFAFDQTKPQGTRAAPDDLGLDVSNPSISIEEPPTRAEPRAHRASSAPSPVAARSPASSQMITLMVDGTPAPPGTAPAGTPGHSVSAISAQRSSQLEPAALGEEYRAAVAAYARGEVLPPSSASTDAAKTAMLRPSGRVDAPAGARTSGLRDGAPGPVPPSSPPAPASSPMPVPVPPIVRARDSQAPPLLNRTLLDGAAALRSRSASQAAAIPSGSPTIPSSSPPPASASMMAVAPPPGMQPPPSMDPALHRDGPLRPGSARLEVPIPEPDPERRSSAAMVVVLVLLAAGLAAAGVYFVLPYLT